MEENNNRTKNEQITKSDEEALEKSRQKTEGKDGFLITLSYLANEFELSFPITLTVGGLLVSGVTVSNKRFANHFVDSVNFNVQALSDENKEALQNNFLNYLLPEPPDKNNPHLIEDIRYIHLGNAHIRLPAASSFIKSIPTSNEGVLWRGLIKSVDGFFFGMLAPDSPNSADTGVE
jgi:hypothetical protein